MAQEFNTILTPVAINFLEALNVPFTKKVLKQNLEVNPYYPSLFSLSEEFKRLNIENKGLEIEIEQLNELPLPFLAHMKIKEIGSKDFVNVTKLSEKSVTFFDGKERTISKDEFIERWESNIVFLAQVNDNSGERDYVKNRKSEINARNKLSLLLIGAAAILLSCIYNYIISSNIILASSTFLLLILMGLTVSVLLLIYEIDKSNTFVKNICTGGVKTNCNAILESEAAKIFNMSWSEIGFFYFCFLFLFLLIPALPFSEKKPFISYLSAFTAAYIPYSIFYQYKVAKQWCRLCLFVQTVLFLSLVWTFVFGDFSLHANANNIIFFIGCAISPLIIWYSFKPVIVKAKDAAKFSSAYKRLFTQPGVFRLTLAEQPEAPDGWQNMGIYKGNPDAENIILKVCSPTCGHCFTSHAIFNEILNNNSNVRLVIIYDIWEEWNDRRLPVRHFLALAELDINKQIEAMDYWYLSKDRNYETLKQKFPVDQKILERQDGKINKMSDWCKIAQVEYTPTVYINGKQLPSTFNFYDLKDLF